MYKIIDASHRVLLLSDSGTGKSKKNIPLSDLAILQKNCSRIFKNTAIDIHFTQFIETTEQHIVVEKYTPHIHIFYAPQSSICRYSYYNRDYSIAYHPMFNHLELSDKGKDLSKKIQEDTF